MKRVPACWATVAVWDGAEKHLNQRTADTEVMAVKSEAFPHRRSLRSLTSVIATGGFLVAAESIFVVPLALSLVIHLLAFRVLTRYREKISCALA